MDAATYRPLTPQQADDLVAVRGWTFVDVCELVHAYARKVGKANTLKLTSDRISVWIKKGRA